MRHCGGIAPEVNALTPGNGRVDRRNEANMLPRKRGHDGHAYQVSLSVSNVLRRVGIVRRRWRRQQHARTTNIWNSYASTNSYAGTNSCADPGPYAGTDQHVDYRSPGESGLHGGCDDDRSLTFDGGRYREGHFGQSRSGVHPVRCDDAELHDRDGGAFANLHAR